MPKNNTELAEIMQLTHQISAILGREWKFSLKPQEKGTISWYPIESPRQHLIRLYMIEDAADRHAVVQVYNNPGVPAIAQKVLEVTEYLDDNRINFQLEHWSDEYEEVTDPRSIEKARQLIADIKKSHAERDESFFATW